MAAWQPENAEAFLGKDGLIDTHRLLDATAEAERLARLDSQHEGIPVSDPRFHMPFSDPATAREVLAQLGVARMLRLVEWLDGAAGEAADNAQALLLRSDTTEAGRFIRTVLDALHRQDLLGRIFAPERLQALLAARGEPAKEAA